MNSKGRIGLIIPEINGVFDYDFIDGAFTQAKELGFGIIYTLKNNIDLNNFAENFSDSIKNYLQERLKNISFIPEVIIHIEEINTSVKTEIQAVINESILLLSERLFSIALRDDIINARINRAEQMLKHTDMRIREIAFQCGYNSETHFMRQFKEKTNVTASDYRKQNKLD